MTKFEFQSRAVAVMRGIFEARIAPGLKAGDVFEESKVAAIRQLEQELEAAGEIDWHRFNAGYLQSVNPDTVFLGEAA